MNFSEVTPIEIYRWIQDRDNGNDENYNKGKEDTQEAIDVFRSLYSVTFSSPYKLFIHLCRRLSMRHEKFQSFYRSFLVLNNDEVVTIRLSQHFATQHSTKKAYRNFGKPNIEYHLIIERTQLVNPNKDIFYDRRFKSVTFKIREMSLAEFNDGHFRKETIDEIIKLLTYGSSGNNNAQINTETKSIKINKNVIRLTESQFKQMLSECIFDVINEEKGKKKIGDYTALDGQWWDGLPHGLEDKGLVQDARMYDRLHKDGTIDTIGLFRRCDNRKFFYARIIPIKDSKETKWKQIKRTDVPHKILDDFATINPQGHEPYLPF